MTHHALHESYAGPATLAASGHEIAVDADLRARFEPIDGRLHWYGRLAATPMLEEIGSGTSVTIATEHGWARGRLSDVDPWGRPRISGTGRPPF